ncbi:hypothetical protein [Rhodococcus daqingensis]|uniref:Secreted protein n=1 Tax=Rhodococcus daqingensis TaxID=2479363 RepID=A0ABW2RZJ6_9NOCA
MIYLLALVVLVVLAVLLWKAFGPDTSTPPAGRVLGPDDDPEFLWRMSRKARPSSGDSPDGGPKDPPD